jgi:DNA-binding GntR family transcriptional regulator
MCTAVSTDHDLNCVSPHGSSSRFATTRRCQYLVTHTLTDIPETFGRTRSAVVTAKLREDILTGHLSPGARLRQTEVAERLNVSTTPVREAFMVLAQEGLVVRDPHRGVVVFQPTVAELRETYDIRIALEPLATALAASRLSLDELAELEQVLDEMRATSDRALRLHFNARFHALIYSRANRPRLLDVVMREQQAAGTYLRLISRLPDGSYQQGADSEHQAIMAALHAQDAGTAYARMEAHLVRHRDQIEQVLLAGGAPVPVVGIHTPAGGTAL